MSGLSIYRQLCGKGQGYYFLFARLDSYLEEVPLMLKR